MRISYKIPEFPEPGDSDLSKGIDEINKKNYKKAQKCFEKSAIYGNEYGQLFCALIHFGGFDISKRNPIKALEYFRAAETEWKNKIAQFFIGIMYMAGDGVVEDKEVSWEWIEKSAGNDCIIAKALLARVLTDEIEGHKRSLFFFKQVVDSDLYNSNTLCLFENFNLKVNFDGDNLNNPFQLDESTICPDYLMSYKDITVTDDFNIWLLWYNLTNNPYDISMCQLRIGGLYFSDGTGIEKDYSKSLEYFYKSAKHQNPLAYRFIGIQFREGIGAEQDYTEAYKNFSKAKNLGDVESILYVAMCSFSGKGVSENYRTALSHLENYVSHKNASNKAAAHLTMGLIYREGKNGINKDCKKAISYFEKSWEQGNDIAAFEIGEMYDEGVGVKKNKKNAIDWYLKAASLNFYPAYYKLGCLELLAHKNRDDLVRALDYFRKAEENGIIEAKEMIDQVTLLLFMSLRLSK